MEERRRAPRVPTNDSITEDRYLAISNGTIINISEYGIRYSQLTATEIETNSSLSPAVRTIYFSLPGNDKYLRLTCSVIAEIVTGDSVEISGDFICLSDEDRLTIREYVDRRLS